MSELISGKEALIALANGEKLQARDAHDWKDVTWDMPLSMFDMPMIMFRLKPRTITLNNIEVPAPFEPKEGGDVWCISDDHGCGYCCYEWHKNHSVQFGAWRTEDEIKQVVSALRLIFKGGV